MTFEQEHQWRQPPGWYPEPGDRQSERYWDGTQWTPSTRMATPHGGAHATSNSGLGVLGLILTLVGVAAAIIAFTAVNWLDFDLGDHIDTFSMSRIGSDSSVQGFVSTYCAWLGWLLVVVAGLTSLTASLPVPNRNQVRNAALAVSLAALLLTVAAVIVLVHEVGDAHNLSVGPWLAMGGFVFLVFGAAAGLVGTSAT